MPAALSRGAPPPMSRRRNLNPRRFKTHRNYTVEEAADLLGVHKGTVRNWLKRGDLATIDDRRPALILGRALAQFLSCRRQAGKRPCQPGEIYCVRCRVPRAPAGRMVDFQPNGRGGGSLIGLCPVCDGLMYRQVGAKGVDMARGALEVTIPAAPIALAPCEVQP